MADFDAQKQNEERVCWQCGGRYPSGEEFCPDDGARLVEAHPTAPRDPRVGTVYARRFEILERLGEGGMSLVYSARWLEGGDEVALKVLKASFLQDDHVRRRFISEARIIAEMDHPNAVDVYDFGQAPDGSFYMVMELLDGESLADLLAERCLTYGEIMSVFPPVADVLAEAHRLEVVHRDLKPENIYLSEARPQTPSCTITAKLLDFGIAKRLHHESLTESGGLLGTPAYMSPEQAGGRTIEARSDIYSMGVMLYEAISGRTPFVASTPMGLAVKHLHWFPERLTSLPGIQSLPSRLGRLVEQMLAKAPESRPASMNEVADELRAIGAELPRETWDTAPARAVDREAFDACMKAREEDWSSRLEWRRQQAGEPRMPESETLSEDDESEVFAEKTTMKLDEAPKNKEASPTAIIPDAADTVGGRRYQRLRWLWDNSTMAAGVSAVLLILTAAFLAPRSAIRSVAAETTERVTNVAKSSSVDEDETQVRAVREGSIQGANATFRAKEVADQLDEGGSR